MSGKKMSDVTRSVTTHSRACESEINAANRKMLRVTKQKRIKPLPKFNAKLIEKYFPKVFTKQLQTREKLISEYKQGCQDASEIVKQLKQLSSMPRAILKDLQRMHDRLLKSGRIHGMDTEYTQAEQLGRKLKGWKQNMRGLSTQLENAQYGKNSLDDIPQHIRLIDNQLKDMASEAVKFEKQMQFKLAQSELITECKQQLKQIDTAFVERFLTNEMATLTDTKALIADNSNPDLKQLKNTLSQLKSLVVQINNKQQAIAAETEALSSAKNDIQSIMNELRAYDPIKQVEVTAQEFYQSYDESKLAGIDAIAASINKVKQLIENVEFDQAQSCINTERQNIEKISQQLRDDAEKATDMIGRAMNIRQSLADKGLAGDGNLDISVDQMLNDGVSIKTMYPKGAYFDIQADGSMEANVDPIASECVKGMAGFAEALAREGYILKPKNFTLADPKKSTIKQVSKDRDTKNQ